MRALWAIGRPCDDPTQPAFREVESCEVGDEEAAATMREAAVREMEAIGVRATDESGRQLHTFTVASSAIGTAHPKTWRLATHSLADAEEWAEVLTEHAALAPGETTKIDEALAPLGPGLGGGVREKAAVPEVAEELMYPYPS